MLIDRNLTKMAKSRSKSKKKRRKIEPQKNKRGVLHSQRQSIFKGSRFAKRGLLRFTVEHPFYFEKIRQKHDAKIHKVPDEIDTLQRESIIHQRFVEDAIAYNNARKVCKNRRERRQVLFAKRKAGKGRSGPKKRKYTEQSKVRC